MLTGRPAQVSFIVLFAALTFVGMQINFSALLGADNQFFTLFQFFGPMAGTFLGPVLGGISILLSEVVAKGISGQTFDLVTIVRLFPMVFGAVFFSVYLKKQGWKDVSIIIPLLAILAFWAHPVGQTVWYFALFWLIPLITKVFSKRLIFRSLGATFTAHAVGGAIWIWTVPTTTGLWNTLIPIVAYERALFAIGIAVSYLVLNAVIARVEAALKTGVLHADKEYLFVKS